MANKEKQYFAMRYAELLLLLIPSRLYFYHFLYSELTLHISALPPRLLSAATARVFIRKVELHSKDLDENVVRLYVLIKDVIYQK